MRKIIAFCALILLTVPAFATDITFSFGNKSRTFVITPMNAARVVAWATAAYPTIPNPAFTISCGCPQTLPNPEPVLSYIDDLWTAIRDTVIRYEKDKNAKALPEPNPVN